MSAKNGRVGEVRPAFWFYAHDWLASSRVQTMSAEQEGGFIHLLCYQWTQGCPLPLGRSALLRMARVADTDDNWNVLAEAFPENQTCMGRVNQRLERERALAEKWSRMASARGKLGAERTNESRKKRASSAQEARKGVANGSLESGSPSPSPSSEKKKTRARPPAAVFDWQATLSEFPSLNTLDVRKALAEYLDLRKKKAPSGWTTRGMQIAMRRLVPFGPTIAVEALEDASVGPWLTLHPRPRNASAVPKPSPPSQKEYKADPEWVRKRMEQDQESAARFQRVKGEQ